MERDGGHVAPQAVREWLGHLEVGEGKRHERMAVFRVFAEAGGVALEYRTLAEAVAVGSA